jgi:anti-anti-sigma regulatory factor
VTGGDMSTTSEQYRTIAAPRLLGVDTDRGFRERATEEIKSISDGNAVLVVDLSDTQSIDTAGLATLASIHRVASENRCVVRLKNPNEEIRFSLVLARLEQLFELED